MRRIWLLLGLCACGETPRSVVHAQYRPAVASESWCRLSAGVFAFVPHPQGRPLLLGHECTAPRRDPAPAEAEEVGSTFAELVVEPGGSIEIPVQLPEVLQGVGCRIDSVLIPHGKRSSDLAIEIASAGRVVPIVSYAQLPPPPGEGVSPRSVVSDGPGRRAIWAPDAPSGASLPTVIADPELWPTHAVLRFDGARTADGAPSVAFEIEPEPEPPPAEEPAKPEEPGTEPPSGAPSADAPPSPPSTDAPPAPAPAAADAQAEPAPPEGDAPPEPTPPPIRQPATLVLVAYRHRIDIAAPDSFSIVLRARERELGIGVRSDRESADPRLSYRAPGAADPIPTHLVPQVAVVVSRCGRPVDEVLRDIR